MIERLIKWFERKDAARAAHRRLTAIANAARMPRPAGLAGERLRPLTDDRTPLEVMLTDAPVKEGGE